MRPVVVLLLGAWMAGIVVGVLTDVWIFSLVVSCVWVGVAFLMKRPAAVVVAAGIVGLLGWMYGGTAATPVGLACPVADEVAGTVSARPDIRENSVRYVVRDGRGCLFFVYADRWPIYEAGSEVVLHGGRYKDQAAVAAENPGFGDYVRRQGVAGIWSYPDVQALQVAVEPAYRSVAQRAHTIFVEPDASLIGALLLAERGQLPEEMIEDFRRTSLTHILSISGAHISLLAAMLFGLVALAPVSPLLRTIAVIGLLWGYVWFVGFPVTAVRAGFFWSVALVALRLGLLVSMPTAIILTLAFMLTWRPALAADLGLQLSFLAVAGIFTALFLSKPWRREGGGVWRGIISAALVSLGATLFTWPLISYHFGIVSLSAVAANLLIVPAVPVIMAGSVAAMAASYISPLLSYIIAWPVHAATAWMMAVARILGSLPGTWLPISVPLWFVVGYYLVLMFCLLAALRWQGRLWREVWE